MQLMVSINYARVVELVDTRDLKSLDRNIVPVQVRPRVPYIDFDRINKINNRQSTVADEDIEFFLNEKDLNLTATYDKNFAYEGASFVVIATPTNYDPATNEFDTSSVDEVSKDALNFNPNALVVIKSTIPVGYKQNFSKKYNTDRIIFSPEFLREGIGFKKDNSYSSRIIVSSNLEDGKSLLNFSIEGAIKKDIETLFIPTCEDLKTSINKFLLNSFVILSSST